LVHDDFPLGIGAVFAVKNSAYHHRENVVRRLGDIYWFRSYPAAAAAHNCLERGHYIFPNEILVANTRLSRAQDRQKG